MKPFHSQWLLFFVVFFCSIVFAQDTIHVPADYQTIQEAINAVSNGDVILVAEGTYFENLQITSKSITLGSHFLIDGDTSHVSRTIINGSQPLNPDQASVIWVRWSAEPTVICGFRITGGFGTKPPNTGETRVGGGINAIRSNITITDNQIINNSLIANDAATGAGIHIRPWEYDSLLIIIRNNLIADNYAESEMTYGGGIAITHNYQNNFNYLIENNTIRLNIIQNTDEWKAMGGGIALSFYLPTSGSQIIRNNIITGNEAHCQNSFGGGMYIIISESISDGSVDNDPGPYIYNNIISDNHSDYLGGAVAVWRAYFPFGSEIAYPLTSWGHYTPKPSFVNNTIVDNTAEEDGAGFFIMNHIPFLMNSILWNDYPSSADSGEIFLGDDSTWTAWVEPNTYGDVEIHYTDIQAGWDSGEGNINLDPSFSDTLFHLADWSPCIGAGKDSIEIGGIWYYAPPTCYFGGPRPNPPGSLPDMGACENPLSNPIPVELIAFTATSYGKEVILNWSTATETNNSGFSIERKYSKTDYSEIGFVPGFGTTTETKSYSYIDSNASVGIYTYRLKQIDFDGSYEYSTEVEVEVSVPLEFSLEQNYPNPFNPSTKISWQSPVASHQTLKVFDVLGNEIATLVDEYKPAGRYEVEFNAAALPSGVYFYQLKAGSFIEVKKMLLLK